ncbi:MAG: type II toxin-antitoxin system Phd/YefM family antitoxin [candidate division KSB1 bacterium]|nr:type II toxin-antitoxin system Phd/YefM family antitoxin [candidate division KSB1 bacterium]MDZ7304021.1 type II toxin-antitoxin system Phd/YefM family antitoxin [candidate division KSB1 bacterium]MDZ7313269.1 type II toxin-antitoxin system Phd/YefM family antitoxin [candidate division KSB1 bacterium]
MKSQDAVKSLGYLMTHADHIIEEMHQSRQPVIITRHGEPCAVLQEFEDYERQRDALIMLQLLARWKHAPQNERSKSNKRSMAKAEPHLRKMRKAG